MSNTTELKSVLEKISAMEAQLVGLRKQLGDAGGAGGGKVKKERKPRDPDAPKREPNEWIKFTLRVDAALKAADQGFKRVAEAKQFAAFLKSQKAYADWADEEILAQRAIWTPPVKPAAEDGDGSGAEDTEELREELRAVGKAALEAGEDVDAALAAAVAKKRGRKPMTAEEKAAAKAEREAKLAAMSPAEKEALAAKKAAAKEARAAKKAAGGGAEGGESEADAEAEE